jgi:SnoaL-like domain
MAEAQKIAEQYIKVWNETDQASRQQLLRTGWTADARYVDPLTKASGPREISAMIGEVQQRFPGFRFKLAGAPNGHNDHIRFSWNFGPPDADPPIEGSDVLTLTEGRIAQVIGFLDRVPAQA